MVKKGEQGRSIKRFTVALEEQDYVRLLEITQQHRPRLPLQYAVQYAVQLFLERAEDPQFVLQLGDPFPSRGSHD